MIKNLLPLFLVVLVTMASAQERSIEQQKNKTVKTALLLVDIQNFYFPGESGPGLVHPMEASLAAKELLQIFRNENQSIVHVRHQTKKGFEIHTNVTPLVSEKIITKEEVNSFYKTDLLEYLKAQAITRLVVAGMQTQMCLEAAVRAAHDLGFECIVVQEACATRDLKFGGKIILASEVQAAVFATLTDGRYAKVVGLKDFKEDAGKYLYQSIK